MYSSQASYAAARTAAAADQIQTTDDGFAYVGQDNQDVYAWKVNRAMFLFDTSGVNDLLKYANITSFEIGFKLTQCWNPAAVTFNLVAIGGLNVNPHDPVVNADFLYSYYGGTTLGSIPYSELQYASFPGYFHNLDITSSKASWFNPSGVSKFCLRSSRDISGTAPVATKAEWIRIEETKLFINYDSNDNVKISSIENVSEIHM